MTAAQTKREEIIIEDIHYLIFFLHVVGTILLIFSPTLRIYAAIYIGLIGLAQMLNKGACPVTLKENELRKKNGEKPMKGFVYFIFKKHFNINLPDYSVGVFSWVTFIAAYLVIAWRFL